MWWLILIFILFGLIANICEFLTNNFIKILKTYLIFLMLNFIIDNIGFNPTIIIILIYFVLIFLIKKHNEKKLNNYLINNCLKLSFMSAKDWNVKLPIYSKKIYVSSFYEITNNFTNQTQQKYIIGDKEFNWATPVLSELNENSGIRSLNQLTDAVLNAKTYTHNINLKPKIENYLDDLCRNYNKISKKRMNDGQYIYVCEISSDNRNEIEI